MTKLTYVGGPYDGQKRDSLTKSGREIRSVGAMTAAKAKGFTKGLYRRSHNTLVWVRLEGEWGQHTVDPVVAQKLAAARAKRKKV